MSNWNKYQDTLISLNKKINYYESQLTKYYLYLIKKEEKKNIDKNILNKNIAIFTYFNNVPDVFHPLSKDIYMNYSCYISFIDPQYFDLNNTDIIKHKYLLSKKYFKQKYMVKQDVSPYNYKKRNLSINIKYFDIKKFLNKKYVLIIYTDKNNKYIVNNDLNTIEGDIVYVNVLREFKSNELKKVFKLEKIKKGTKLYSYHSNKKDLENLDWFSFSEDNYLNDPFNVWYKKGDKMFQHLVELNKNINVVNLSKNIFLENNENLDNLILDKHKKGNIYNGFMNYIKYYNDKSKIWNNNRGKRLLNEIIFKNSNFINLKLYYFDFLNYHNFNQLIYSYGFYEKLNKYYHYEIGFFNNKKLLKLNDIKEVYKN
jgi:hypothetical protein